jgi:ABC-type oligopeptide transport system ATPase subunit
LKRGNASRLCPGNSDVDLFGYGESVIRFRLASSRAEGRELIAEALRAVGLRPEEILGRFPHQLSGGHCQENGLLDRRGSA